MPSPEWSESPPGLLPDALALALALELLLEVDVAWLWPELEEQERALLGQRRAVADALRHATNRYRAGYSSYLEQIDAQRALLAVDLSLVQLRSDRLTAYVALYQALGGGAA